MSDFYMDLQHLTVGYNRKALIADICVGIKKGEIVTLIGPNGSGKSTILKSIAQQLKLIGGKVVLDETDMVDMSEKLRSTKMAVVLTDRMQPELMTCYDIVATGRYPYTGRLGILSRDDEAKVEKALELVHASELGNRDFNSISDGQKQRIMLARAICQEPDVIVLDEPTSYLDIHYKLELLSIVRNLAREGMTVVMSLHEIDLAQKISDKIICVREDGQLQFGAPEEIFHEATIRSLYAIENGCYDPRFGSLEMPRVEGNPEVFVISSGGTGIPIYRQLQKKGVPFAAGILYTNDIDYQLAKQLAVQVITEQPFQMISDRAFEEAVACMQKCRQVINAGVDIGVCNERVRELLRMASL